MPKIDTKKKRNRNSIKNILLFLYVLLILVTSYHLFYAKRIIPGVKVGNVYVGGMTFDEAVTALTEYEQTQTKVLSLKYEDNYYEITPVDIDLTYDWEGSVTRAFEVGRTGKIIQDTKDKAAGFFKKLYIGAYYDYSDDLLTLTFSLIDGDVNIPVVDSKFVLNDTGELEISPANSGQKVDSEALYAIFSNAYDRLSFHTRVLPLVQTSPDFTPEELAPFKDQVSTIIETPLTVTYENLKWELTKEKLLPFIGFSNEDGKVDLKLNNTHFEAFLDLLAQEVNKLPRGSVVELDGDRVVKFEITQPGIELDKKEFTEVFKDALFTDASNVAVVVKEVSELDGKNKYGIVSLLGEGTSKFTGSSQARINNLTLAASRTSGVLVPPGEVYSMNNAVGEISSATGYDTAYIIQQGRTVLGAGGGVCQTSTTMFRAVLNSGLPVVMRYPHDYRVYYYEIDGGPGKDATIFQPTIDFKFKNDTPGYLLIQAAWDLEETSLKFSIYGTPDGREVEMSDVVVTGETPPPPALYQEDPTLPKGVTRQVDFSAWGATASFNRTVLKNGEVHIEDSYTTRYQPWRAIFLVGTKE